MRVASLALALGLTAAGVAHAGSVDVSFADASRFSDVGVEPWRQQANLDAIARHLQTLGKRYLGPQDELKVEVLDVDLAGYDKLSRVFGREVRVVRGGADIPRIALRYTLQPAGKPARSGEETVTDLDYSRGVPTSVGNEPLHFEKRMLDRWFRARFAAGAS